MCTYEKEDWFEGADYLGMLNDAGGTRFKTYKRSYIELDKLGYPDKGIAWVVFMDGKPHGPNEKYLWKNRISRDGETIEEEYVGTDKRLVKKYVAENEIRVSFQRDPFGIRQENLCRFVGVFRISEYRDTEKGFIRIYEKISGSYPF